jgi:outer membrane protein assembly factor BamB
LAQGVLASAKELIRQAVEFDQAANDDPLITTIRTVLTNIEKTPIQTVEIKSSASPISRMIKSTRWNKPRTDQGFSFGFQFAATSTDLLSPSKPLGSDLNALLFKGQHVVFARGQRRTLGSGFLFLQTERLLASLRRLLASWEEGRPMSVRLIADGLIVGVRLGKDDGLDVSFMDSSKEDAILVLNGLTPWEYADAVLGVARELRRLIVKVNPSQRRNMRLEAFSREVKALSAWVKEQRRGAVINKDVDRYRNLTEPKHVSSSPVLIGSTSRLLFRERWRLEVEGLKLGGTMLCRNMAIVSAKSSMLGVDNDSGAIVWRREFDRSDTRLALAEPDGIVRATPSGNIEMLDIASGVVNWRTTLGPRSGGSPVLLVIDHGPAPGLVIAAEEERKIVALDKRSGEPCWRFTASRGGRFALRRYGKLLYIASNDSHFNAVDVEDGSLVWRFTDRTRFLHPPAVNDDTVLVVGGRPNRLEGRMYALDAFSGEPRWDTPLNGGPMTSPIVADGVALTPVRSGPRYEFIAIDIASGRELWRRACSGWADSSALMALDNYFIINSAGGAIYAVGAKDGKEKWSTVLGPVCSDDIPMSLRIVKRGGMLFVPADTVYVVSPDDGRIIHTLGNESPVPDLLNVSPDCAVFAAEDSGHIAMYNLSSQLSVVS